MMHFSYTGMKTQVASNLQGNAWLVMLDIIGRNESINFVDHSDARPNNPRVTIQRLLLPGHYRNASASDLTVGQWKKNGWQTLVAIFASGLFLDCWPAANTSFRFNFKTLRMSSHLYTASSTTESFGNSLKYLAIESLFLTSHWA